MASSLIEQLQLGAVDGSAPVTDLLRKAKLAAVKLGATEFAAWIDLEMNGYYDETPVPDYREVTGPVRFHNPYHGWRPVLGPEEKTREVRQSIGEVFELAKVKSGFLTIGVPEKFRRTVSAQLGFQCDVQQHVSTVAMHSIVEAVRNKVLDWTLKLEAAGIRGEGITFTPEETRTAQAMFVNHTHNYHGPVASIAHDSNTIGTVSQGNSSATPQEIAAAVGELLRAIQRQKGTFGIPAEAVDNLAASEPELKEGRVPFGKLARAIDLFQKAEDVATRAPEVMSGLHKLGQLLGVVS